MPQLWGIDTRNQVNGPRGPREANESGSGRSFNPQPISHAPSAGGLEALGNEDINPIAAHRAAVAGKTPKAKRYSPADWEDLIQQIVTKMNKGLDFNDPRVKSILDNARATTMQSTNDRGIFGGYSENAAEGSYIKAAAGLQDEQEARMMQLLGMGASNSRGLANDAYSRAMDQYNQGSDFWEGAGSLIGGGLGALGGGLVGGLTAGPGGAVAGALAGAKGGYDFGSKLGAGVGGMGYSATNARPTYGGY